jgi:PKD repeat protein
LTASVDGIALAVSSGNLNQKIANGSATMTITTTGTHTIKVTATDAYGTATASRTFTVTVSAVKQKVTGAVFFDVDLNGVRSTDEYGLSDVGVKLVNTSGQTVATATTASDGSYSFSVLPGSYIVSVGPVNGMSLTTLNDNAITVLAAAVKAPDTGYGLYFAAIRNMCANGYTIGYWKNNIDKALACKSSGTQVSASTIKSYTCAIGSLALEPFAGLTMSKASATMGSTSSAPADLLAKQLVASEYNYCNGAFMNGDRRLTYAFIYYSEYVLKNATRYGSTYVLWVKDWCDAYNNSHGGTVLGPSS